MRNRKKKLIMGGYTPKAAILAKKVKERRLKIAKRNKIIDRILNDKK